MCSISVANIINVRELPKFSAKKFGDTDYYVYLCDPFKGKHLETIKPKDMSEIELNKWYTSLTIADKEAITQKKYPECTKVWNTWTLEERTEAKEQSQLLRGKRINKNCRT